MTTWTNMCPYEPSWAHVPHGPVWVELPLALDHVLAIMALNKALR
jgi:hypothetical protein